LSVDLRVRQEDAHVMAKRGEGFGSAPTTSPRPPVLTKGAHSAAIKAIFMDAQILTSLQNSIH
jgi:hypothetical protein